MLQEIYFTTFGNNLGLLTFSVSIYISIDRSIEFRLTIIVQKNDFMTYLLVAEKFLRGIDRRWTLPETVYTNRQFSIDVNITLILREART